MKKLILASMAGAIAALSFGCSSFAPSHDYVHDIQSITPQNVDKYHVEVPMKDFVVVQPVFAETSVSMSEFLREKFNSEAYSGDGYSKRFSKAKGIHNKTMDGTYLVERHLLEAAYKAGADAIVNINVEYEEKCHDVGVADNFDYESSSTAIVPELNYSGSVSYSHKERRAGDHKAVAESASQEESASISLKKITTGASVKRTFSENQKDCQMVIYGSALAIKYTNAIVPSVVYSNQE